MSIDPQIPSRPSASQLVKQRIRSSANYRVLNGILHGGAAQKGLLSTADQAVISLGNFLASVYLARELDPTEFGVYSVGFLLMYLGRAIVQGLVIQPVSALGAVMEDDDFRRYNSSSGLMMLGLVILMSAGTALVGWVLTRTGNLTLGPGVFALWFVLLLSQLQEYLRGLFYVRGRVHEAVIISAIDNTVRIVLLIWWSRHAVLSGVNGLYAIGYGSLVAVPLGIWFVREWWTLKNLALRETVVGNWQFGRWLLGGLSASWATQKVYPIITAGMISFSAAGTLRALQNLVAPVHVLLAALDPFLTPRAAKRYKNLGVAGLRQLLRTTYAIYTLPIVLLLAVATIFAEPLLQLLYNSTYSDSSSVMLLMALYYALWSVYFPLQSALKALGSTRPYFFANLLAIASMFTLGPLAIRFWGIRGTMLGQSLNALLICLVLWHAWRSATKKAAVQDPGQGLTAEGS